MKKLLLSSLVAVFAVSGANAANFIDGNPLYMPRQNHFYSVTDLGSRTKHVDSWALNEEFGYGFTDRFDLSVSTTVRDRRSFDKWSWDDLSLGANYRALTRRNWNMDLVGGYAVNPIWGYHKDFLKMGNNAAGTGTEYTWTAGVRGGYITSNFTFAMHALLKYWNTRSFNWDETSIWWRGRHFAVLGMDGQFVFNKHWNLVAGAEYTGCLDDTYRGRGHHGVKTHNAGAWTGKIGLNYNIKPTKYVGAYLGADIKHRRWNSEWVFQDGVVFGAKFGAEF